MFDALPSVSDLSAFHFIRPWALTLLVLLPVVWFLLRHAQAQRGAWARLVDPALQRFVLTTSLKSRGRKRSWVWYVPAATLILALAGPTWEQLPQPVYTQQRPVVIALDLSQSMGAQDLIPSRLQVAKIKLQDLLRERRDGQTALITFAGDAFLVTPLTDDTRTIVSMLPSLTPRIMPVQGSRLAPALTLAGNLLEQAGGEAGEVILITDGVADTDAAESAARELANQGHRVSVIATGTEQGGLIKDARGDFIRDRRGNMVMAPVNTGELRAVSDAGRGLLFDANLTDGQIEQMLVRELGGFAAAGATDQEFTTDLWREQGPLLVLLCLPFLAFAFRRGVLLGLLVFVVMPQPYVEAGIWSDAWQRRDQQAAAAFDNEEFERAAELFEHRRWKAAALYRAGNFAQSAATLDGIDTPEAHYNRGNALAKAEEFDSAIKAYERALEQQPDHEDAKFNLELLKQKQQEQQSQQQQQDQQQDQQEGDQQQEANQQQDGDGEDQEPQEGDENEEPEQGESEESEQQNAQEQEGQSDEEREAERREMQAQLAEQMTEEEQQQAVEQWLRRIPDDPGGLLRRKFKRQYRERGQVPRRTGEEW